MGTNGNEAGAFEELAHKFATISAGYHERLPRLEAEVDSAKSASLVCLGVAKEARDTAKEARDAAKEARAAAKSCERAVRMLLGAARDTAREVAQEVAEEVAEGVATDVAEHSSRYDIRKLEASATGPHEKIAEVEKKLENLDGQKKGAGDALTALRHWVLFGIAVVAAVAAFSAWAAAHAGR